LVVYSSVLSSVIRSRAVEFQPQTTMWSRYPDAPMPWPSLRMKSMTKPTSAAVMTPTIATPKRTSSQLMTKPAGVWT
jgi:hypothetical protein